MTNFRTSLGLAKKLFRCLPQKGTHCEMLGFLDLLGDFVLDVTNLRDFLNIERQFTSRVLGKERGVSIKYKLQYVGKKLAESP